MTPKILLSFALAAAAVAAHAQLALDRGSDSAYTDGWAAGDNGGTGFGAWTNVGGDATFGGSTGVTDVSQIGGASFTLAGAGSQYSGADARRPFAAPLAVGDVFSFDFKQSDLTNALGEASFGVVLRNAAGQEMTSAFGYFYNQFNVTPVFYTSVANGPDKTTDLNSGVDYRTAGGVHVAFSILSTTGFSVSVGGIGVAPSYTSVGVFRNAGPVAAVGLFSYESNANAPLTVNNLRVDAVPEPATFAALGIGAAAMLRRRRR